MHSVYLKLDNQHYPSNYNLLLEMLPFYLLVNHIPFSFVLYNYVQVLSHLLIKFLETRGKVKTAFFKTKQIRNFIAMKKRGIRVE